MLLLAQYVQSNHIMTPTEEYHKICMAREIIEQWIERNNGGLITTLSIFHLLLTRLDITQSIPDINNVIFTWILGQRTRALSY